MSAVDTLRTALYGNPPSPDFRPSQDGVLAAFNELQSLVSLSAVGIGYFDTAAAMNATTPGGDDPKVAIVTGNGAGIYKYTGSLPWNPFDEFFDSLAQILEANLITAIKDNVVAQGTATVASNTTSGTQYNVSVNDIFETVQNNALIEFVVPQTSLGAVTINLDSVGIRNLFMVRAQPLRAGCIVRFRKNDPGSNFVLVAQNAQAIELSDTDNTARAGVASMETLLGAYIQQLINNNENEFYVNFNNWVNDTTFYVYIVETNTAAAPIINMADGRRRAIAECDVGDLKAGELAELVVSFGIDNVIYRGSTPIPKLADLKPTETDLIAKFVENFHANQWNLDGTPEPFPITTAGSSVTTERADRNPATDYAPSHRFVDALNGPPPASGDTGIPSAARVPGTVAIDDNWSHGGHAISQFYGQLLESTYFNNGQSKALWLNPGPNDFRVAGYNSGQTLPGGITVMESLVVLAQTRGIPCFITLPFDPDVSRENYASFFTNEGAAIAQSYPTSVPAPVNPNTGQYPPANDSTGVADMTGHGVPIPYDRRFEHGSAQLRILAAKYPNVVVLIDSRKAFHRAVEALQPDAYSKNLLYGPTDPIHPLRYAHDRAFGFPINDLAQDILAGRSLSRCYDGGEWRDYGEDAV